MGLLTEKKLEKILEKIRLWLPRVAGELCHIFSQQDWVIREEHVYQYGSASHDHAPCLESSGRKLGLAHYGSRFIRASRSMW